MTNNIKIISLNANGLSSPAKRGKVMAKLRKEKVQIAFLHETHLTQSEHKKLRKFADTNIYYTTHRDGRKRGVVILLANSIQFDCEMEFKDKEGRFITIRGKTANQPITLVNVYAPHESDKHFFKYLFDVIAVESEGTWRCVIEAIL